MTPLSEVPFSAVPWLVGAIGCLVLSVKSFYRYRRSRVELMKYIAWFTLWISLALAWFSVPSFFTLDLSTIRNMDLVGEFFFYGGMVVQSLIVWLLILRPYVKAYVVAIPVGVIGLAAWLYALPRAHVHSAHHFINYYDPRLSTFVIAGLLAALFVPVGIYFLRLAPRQSGFKAILNSVAFGVVYIGIGLSGAGFEITTGQELTRESAVSNTIFFSLLLIAAAWPRRADPSSSPFQSSANAAPTGEKTNDSTNSPPSLSSG